jgi:hypothetical protein
VALAELQDDGKIEAMTVEHIAKHVREKVLVLKLKQFKDRAAETRGALNERGRSDQEHHLG